MKAFGIEIRKVGDVKGLFKEVDIVLSKAGITSSGITSDLQSQTVAHALQKMIKVGKWFDVCTINNCAEACNIHIPAERVKIYRAIHCIDWNEMLPDYRQTIIAMVLDDFRGILNPTLS